MKQYFVVDSSIVTKWFSPANELLVREADELMDSVESGKVELYAPVFLLLELTNILLKKKHFPVRSIDKVIQNLIELGIHFIDFDPYEMPKLLRLCEDQKLSTYDGLYLFLAKEKNCGLITADEELLAVVGTSVSLQSWKSGVKNEKQIDS